MLISLSHTHMAHLEYKQMGRHHTKALCFTQSHGSERQLSIIRFIPGRGRKRGMPQCPGTGRKCEQRPRGFGEEEVGGLLSRGWLLVASCWLLDLAFCMISAMIL